MIKKQKNFETSVFILTAILITALGFSFFFTFSSIEKERLADERKIELIDQSSQLAAASDYLTAEVRKFAVTLNPVHLRKYWTEINVTRTREKIIARLTELEIPVGELELLTKAKYKSDNLVNIETRSMKLILRVYGVPEIQMEKAIQKCQLSEEDEGFSLNKKVNLAREILYDQNYDNEKNQILAPIRLFQLTVEKRVNWEKNKAMEITNLSLYLLIFLILVTSAYIIFFAHLILQRISFPLKEFLLNASESDKNAMEIIQKSRALPIIKRVISSFKKNWDAVI